MAEHEREPAAPAPSEKVPATSAVPAAFTAAGQVPVLTAISTDGVLALQRTAGNRAVMRLVENFSGDPGNAKPATSTPIDIPNLTEQRADAHLRRLRAQPGIVLPLAAQTTITQGRTTWVYEVGDDLALAQRKTATSGQTAQAYVGALGGDAAEAQHRNVQTPLGNLQQLVTGMSQGGGAGGLPAVTNFEEWLLVSERFNNPQQRFDALNELREAATQPAGAGPIDLAESAIPGTTQTADLQQGQTQTEIKTVRDPITQPNQINAQLGAALTKFRQAGPTKPLGARYRAVVYASYDAALLGGAGNRTFDPATGNVTTTFTPTRAKTEWFFEPIRVQLNRGGMGDVAAVDEVAIRMENGPGALIENQGGNWVKR